MYLYHWLSHNCLQTIALLLFILTEEVKEKWMVQHTDYDSVLHFGPSGSLSHGCIIKTGYRTPRCGLFSPMWIARLVHTPKKFLAFGLLPGLRGSLNMRSSVNLIMPLVQPACSYTVVTPFRKKKKTFLGFKSFTKIKHTWLKNVQYKE